MTKMAAKWLNSIPNLWAKQLKNHTLCGRTYLYSPYKGVPPPPGSLKVFSYNSVRNYKWPQSWRIIYSVAMGVQQHARNPTNIFRSNGLWLCKSLIKWFKTNFMYSKGKSRERFVLKVFKYNRPLIYQWTLFLRRNETNIFFLLSMICTYWKAITICSVISQNSSSFGQGGLGTQARFVALVLIKRNLLTTFVRSQICTAFSA